MNFLRRPWFWVGSLLVVALLIYLGSRLISGGQHRQASGAEAASMAKGAGGGRGGRNGGDNTPLTVGVQEVMRGDFPIYLDALGTVTPKQGVVVRSRIDGQLLKIHFTEGQWVHAGDLLAEIDPITFKAQVDQARGQMLKDQAQLNNAKLDLQRYERLLAQDSISKQQVDTQQALVQQYQGAVDVDQGAVDNAMAQLAYTRVTAPISGRTGLRQVDPGNLVHASDANGLVSIIQTKPITVLFSLPADKISAVRSKLGAGVLPVEAYDSAVSKIIARGKLQSFDNQIDPASGTIRLRAQFANDDEMLFPNQFVNVRLLLETRRNVLKVPAAAIQIGQSGSFIYALSADNTVQVRNVTTGATDAGWTLLEQGADGGERVVVDGIDRLREGSKVIPRDEATTAAAQGGSGRGRQHRRDGQGASDAAPAAARSKGGQQ